MRLDRTARSIALAALATAGVSIPTTAQASWTQIPGWAETTTNQSIAVTNLLLGGAPCPQCDYAFVLGGPENASGWNIYGTGYAGYGGGGSGDQPMFSQIPGAATLLATDTSGVVWAVNRENMIFFWNSAALAFQSFAHDPTCANPITGIAVNTSSDIWITGCLSTTGVYRYQPASGWTSKSLSSASSVTLAFNGTVPWVTTSSNTIDLWNGAGWAQMPGGAYGIASRGSTLPLVAAGPSGLFSWNGSGWQQVPTPSSWVAQVAMNGADQWYIDGSGDIFWNGVW